MKRSKIILCLFVLICILISKIEAQQNTQLAALGKPGKTCIELRWAPLNFDAWTFGNSNGYVIERSTILRNGKILDPIERKQLTTSPIKIAPETEWAKYENDKYAMIAGECIFGESEIEETDFLPLKAYKKRQDNERRIGFALYSADMSVTAAKLSGLYYKDSDVKEGEKYLYKIMFAIQDSIISDTAYYFTGLSEYQALVAPEKPYYYSEPNSIVIWWQLSKFQKFNSYYIEKSTDNGKTFNKISDTPIAVSMQGKSNKIFYKDTLIHSNLSYQYRLIGIDSFGEESPASEPVVAKLQVPFEKDPDFTDIQTINNNSVKLTWYYQTAADVKGFKIYRSKSLKDKKLMIYQGTDPLQKTFTDNNPAYDNYYYLSVYNDAEEKLNPFPFYAQLIDSIPPAKPSKPEGYCDSLGRVYLSWHPHPDPEVKGYRIFWSNSVDKNFMMLSKNMISDTNYVDTINLNTLSKTIYYKLNAVDGRDNQSELSEVAEIQRYDKISPVAPQFESIESQKNKVNIKIIASPSEDVDKYLIYRKIATAKDFDTISELPKTQLTFTDQNIESGEKYHYGIQAVDDSGNSSDITKIALKTEQQKSDEIQLKKKISGNIVTLSWTTTSHKQLGYVIVYKKVNEKPLTTYSQVSDHNTFTDNKLELGNTYIYCVRIVYDDQTESKLSNEIQIQL